MERWHGADLPLARVKIKPATACFRDAIFNAEQSLRRRSAEADKDVRIRKFDLSEYERQADLRFLWCRRTISRRSPGHDVGYVNQCAIEADRRQHAVEQFAGSADEGQAFNVFVAAGGFANEHQPCRRVAIGEDELRGSCFQGAAIEFVENSAQFVERF